MFIVPNRKVSKVFLHCSASDNPVHDDISIIESWHLQRGFSEVGYHFFIKKDGTIQFGRSLEKVPAAQQGHNAGTIAICTHGLKDFTEESLMAVQTLCEEINHAYDGKITFHGHREVSSKTCPVYDYKTLLNLDDSGYMQGF